MMKTCTKVSSCALIYHLLPQSEVELGMTTLMAEHDHDSTDMASEKQSFRGGAMRELEENKGSHQTKNGKSDHTAIDSDSSDGGGAIVSFSTNHNSVVCLPLVSEGLKLVWTQSDQTRELDGIPELVQAFNVFPYPTSQEVAFLARCCSLPLDKVKVWFMVQRIKYGISWASEEIEETRCKLAGPERGSLEEGERARPEEQPGNNGCTDFNKEIENDATKEEARPISLPSPQKGTKYELKDAVKPPSLPHFRSSLPPPQDSYYYRSPVDSRALAISSPESPPSTQRRHGRYKKSKAQLAVLRSSFLRENWPAEAELRRLQEETGLSRNDIRKWFSDSRYQLRNGRGTPGVAQVFTPSQGADEHPQQLHPLPLVAHGPRNQQSGPRGGSRGRGARNSRVRDTRFFQNFLSTSLEAVGESKMALGMEADEKEVLSIEDTVESLKEEEESKEEQPLQLITDRKGNDSHQPLAAPSSPSPSPATTASSSPATAALPHKRSTAGISSHKSTRSVKSTPSLDSPSLSSHLPSTTSSSSPVLTAAGRPRKTKQQLDVLKQHFLRCQWPKSEDYTKLVELTGLPRADVIQWFGDTRYAVKNGQLRWVRGVRDQFMAELALQQNGGGTHGTPRGGGRKRKLEENGSTVSVPGGSVVDPHEVGVAGNSGMDFRPLELYRRHTGALQEKDLDALCRKSRMSYQQVRDWFACQESGMSDSEVNVTD
ncbi:homeobox and leucine zipper encoding a isoform X2 [Brienomyrus brachyistius]|uniref:homeobox and leucine zipper encoding a isoform X2 n=1 Tax=Brienomyrus brachyistius TaxID=42636 RepID=UPI0020B39772|nr:homeobox and leucine zipper encoding a isoform X2 [Brienomyrus brachyistius]